MDANWRWTHNTDGYSNCYTGSSWDNNYCPDAVTCAQKCAVDGVDSNDMQNTYGVSSDGTTLRLNYVTQGQYSKNVGSRMFMLASDNTNYEMFKLKNKEFSFEVDVSQLPCGLNGALYFVEMDQNGGLGKGNNKAGSKYGTGYCDAQCPHDIKWIDGKANLENWNTGTATGRYGTCCIEMDIWEANSISNAFTPHSCTKQGPFTCEGQTCGD